MLELYHHGSSVCAAKARLALAEKGLKWKGRYVDILKGEQAQAVITVSVNSERIDLT